MTSENHDEQVGGWIRVHVDEPQEPNVTITMSYSRARVLRDILGEIGHRQLSGLGAGGSPSDADLFRVRRVSDSLYDTLSWWLFPDNPEIRRSVPQILADVERFEAS